MKKILELKDIEDLLPGTPEEMVAKVYNNYGVYYKINTMRSTLSRFKRQKKINYNNATEKYEPRKTD